MIMKKADLWSLFEETGRIDAYLKYKGYFEDEGYRDRDKKL